LDLGDARDPLLARPLGLDDPPALEHIREASGLNVYDFFANEEKAVVTGDETLRVIKNGAVFFTEWTVVSTFRGDKIAHILVVENLGALSQAYGAPHARLANGERDRSKIETLDATGGADLSISECGHHRPQAG
jgi:hypothetical protein